jgi:hypothetical protein
MKAIKTFFIPIVLALLIGTASTNAQRINESPQVGYSIDWYTIDGGGAMFSTNGSYSLGGSIGQADAGTLGGGSYTLSGGFWNGSLIQYNLYLPLVLKNS